MKKFQYFAEYFLIVIVDKFVHFIPLAVAVRLAQTLGLLASKVLRARSRLVIQNMTAAYPERTIDHIRGMARDCWKNIGRIAIEFMFLPEFFKNFSINNSVQGVEYLAAAKAEKRGIIYIGFHYVNWEVTGLLANKLDPTVIAIARPIKNPWVQKWVQSKRVAGEREIIPHRNAVKGSLRALRENKSVGILVDQNLYHGGTFVNFFNRPAATTTLPALLELRTGAPVLFLHVERKDNQFNFVVTPAPLAIGDKNSRDWVERRTQQFSDIVEKIIRRCPEQWFWVHNRWKRQPMISSSQEKVQELLSL